MLRVIVGERAEAFPPVASRFSAFKRAGSAGMSLDFLFCFNISEAVCLVFFSKICVAVVVLGRSFSILATKLYACPLNLPCL